MLTVNTLVLAQQLHKVYVSNSGLDSNPGTETSPVKTLNKAIDIVKQKNGGVSVLLKGGYYSLSEGVELSNVNNVKISNLNNEKVVISGGIRINENLIKPLNDPEISRKLKTEAKGKIYEIALDQLNISDYGVYRQHGHRRVSPAPLELFSDNKPLIVARWPNDGYLPLKKVIDSGSVPRNNENDNRGAIIAYDYDRPSNWSNLNSIWVRGALANGYSDDNLQIKHINLDEKTIEFLQPSLYGVIGSEGDSKMTNYRRYFFYNILEELDSPGEWYLDEAKKKIYFWPLSDNIYLNISILEKPLISLNNTDNVSFEGITFGYSRGMGIYAEHTKNTKINNCSFINLGTVAVSLNTFLDKPKDDFYDTLINDADKSNTDFSMNSCTISYTGTGGVLLSGGDRKNLIAANNEINNCDISNYSRLNLFSCPAVTINGVGNKVQHCYIHESSGQGIMYWGNNHEISFNHIKSVVQEISDQGGIYTGRDPSSTGTEIHDNFFDDIVSKFGFSVAAVYIDDGSGGINVNNNVFFNCGSSGEYPFGAIHINGGSNNSFDNNYFINCKRAFSMSSWSDEKWKRVMFSNEMKKKLTSDADINSNLYLQKYPYLKGFFDENNIKPRINTITNTIAYKVGSFTSNIKGFRQSNIIVTDTNPGFVNVSNKNFNIILNKNVKLNNVKNNQSLGSDKINIKDIRPIDFNKIGPRK
ncbi:MAG: right-handed parallel beta-helix repeat-containing protein [Siphonobacter sp.]